MGTLKHVVSFYEFRPQKDLSLAQSKLEKVCLDAGIVGTLLLASEGLNGSLAHDSRVKLEGVLEHVKTIADTFDLKVNWSTADPDNVVFHRLKIRIRPEIVNYGSDMRFDSERGKHVSPVEWDALISDPNTLVLDVRNTYETEVGTFQNAKVSNTRNFREFSDSVVKELGGKKDTPIAMFCTGGIRCEKASQHLVAQGFENVYQLDGGVLNYLRQTPKDRSNWMGECFVFDQRVTVDHSLHQGNYIQCFACRHPLSEEDTESEHYVPAVSCPHCFSSTSDERKERFSERSKQVALANMRGERHIGVNSRQVSEQ